MKGTQKLPDVYILHPDLLLFISPEQILSIICSFLGFWEKSHK